MPSSKASGILAFPDTLQLFATLKRIRHELGYDEYSAKTIDRLLHSRHVEDLRWIVGVSTYSAVFVFLVLLFIITLFLIYDLRWDKWHPDAYKILVPLAIGVLAALGAVITWCYRTGSDRLGVVDLVACEITTLCRIILISDLAASCIRAFKLDVGELEEKEGQTIKGVRTRFSLFESHESYTPIFDGNSKELRSLSVKAVINITAFYTYWKSTRDALRRLAEIDPKADNYVRESKTNPWPRAIRNVIYMNFLACESARKAVGQLIEFEPNSTENIVTILLAELPSYKFLLDSFATDNDVRFRRLGARKNRYREVVQKLLDDIPKALKEYENAEVAATTYPRRTKTDLEEACRDWGKVGPMVVDLREAFKEAMKDPEDPPSPPAR